MGTLHPPGPTGGPPCPAVGGRLARCPFSPDPCSLSGKEATGFSSHSDSDAPGLSSPSREQPRGFFQEVLGEPLPPTETRRPEPGPGGTRRACVPQWGGVKSLSHIQLCDPVDCRPLGSCVLGILQARILERVATSFSRGSSRPRARTLGLLHWQVGSLSLSHQGSLCLCFLVCKMRTVAWLPPRITS